MNGNPPQMTYWARVNAYPSSAGLHDSGLGQAEVQLLLPLVKLTDDAMFTLHVTGGRLQFADFIGRESLSATVRLDTEVSVIGASLGKINRFATVAGHGGSVGGGETFDRTFDGVQILPDGYVEQRDVSGLNTVGATLSIPAQEIDVSISGILPKSSLDSGEFMLGVNLTAEARAIYLDGGAAMVFLRDPTSFDQADPFAGGLGISFTGIEFQAAVPEPSATALLALGLLGIALIAHRRRADELTSRRTRPAGRDRQLVAPAVAHQLDWASKQLMLLWRGVGQFVVRNPRYAVLFGAVSISNRYAQSSRQLIVDFLKLHRIDPALARQLKLRRPFRGPRLSMVDEVNSAHRQNLEELAQLLAQIESDGKGVPILLKQYLKLGGRLLGFNLDVPFGDTLDGLVVVDLRHTDAGVLTHCMGEDGANAFLNYHAGQGQEARVP